MHFREFQEDTVSFTFHVVHLQRLWFPDVVRRSQLEPISPGQREAGTHNRRIEYSWDGREKKIQG